MLHMLHFNDKLDATIYVCYLLEQVNGITFVK